MAMRLDVGALWVRGKTAALDEARQQVDEGFATLRGLRAMGQGAIAILRRSGVVVALTAIAAALLCSAGWLGVIGAAFVIGLGVANAVGQTSHEYRRMATVGAMVLGLAAPCLGAIRVGANLAQQHGEAQFVSGWTLFFGITLVGTFMLLPLLEAAARTAQGSTVSEALAASLVATGRRGLLVTLLLAGVVTAAIAIIPVLDALTPLELLDLRADSHDFSESLAAFGAGAAVTLFVGMLMAATLASEQPAERVRSRSAFALVASAMLVLTTATVAGASLLPAPVRSFSGDDAGTEVSPGGVSAVVDERLAGAPLLFVFQGYERTETIPLAPGDHLYGVLDMPDETVAVLVLHRDETIGIVSVDGLGHRVDDGPLDRITAHLGWAATSALIACALMVIVAMSRTRRRARLHRAVRRHRETLLRGHLRGLELPPLHIASGVARTVGWSFESLDGTTWMALPATMPILGAVRAPLAEGSTIELVSPGPIDRLQFRGGRTPAPPGTALVIPDAGPIEWLVGTWALAPAGGLLGAASLCAIAGMVLTLGGAVDVAPLVLEGADSMAARIESAAPEGDTRPLTDAARRERIEVSTTYRGITFISGTETAISVAFRQELTTLDTFPDRARFDGVLLAGITEGSLLDLLGFQEGDCIVAVAGAPITTTDPILANLGRLLGAGPAVGIRVRRRGVELDLVFRSP